MRAAVRTPQTDVRKDRTHSCNWVLVSLSRPSVSVPGVRTNWAMTTGIVAADEAALSPWLLLLLLLLLLVRTAGLAGGETAGDGARAALTG